MGRRQHAADASGPGCIFYLVLFFIFLWASAMEKNTENTRHYAPARVRTDLYDQMKNFVDQHSDQEALTALSVVVDQDKKRFASHVAAELDRFDLLQKLIKRGDPVSPQDKSGRTPLHLAMAGKCDKAVEVLLEAGADLKAYTRNGYSILHHAARYGYYEVAKAALRNGADPSLEAYGGWTPLHYASREGHLKIVVLLCENGADTSKTIDYGWTAGDLAFGKQFEVARYLQSRGAKFSTSHLINEFQLVDGWPFFSPQEVGELSGTDPLFKAVAEDSSEKLAELKEYGADFNIRNRAKTPLLCLAVLHQKFNVAFYLLKYGSDPDAVDANGKNALIYAVEANNGDFVKEILKKKPDLSHADSSGNTALYYAVSLLYNDIAIELIDSGADIFAENNFGQGMMHAATANSNDQMFVVLIKNGCDVNHLDIRGNTPLHLAVINDNLSVVETLLKNGADFAIRNNRGETPEMLAKNSDIARVLKNRFEIEGQNPAERQLPAEVIR